MLSYDMQLQIYYSPEEGWTGTVDCVVFKNETQLKRLILEEIDRLLFIAQEVASDYDAESSIEALEQEIDQKTGLRIP